MSNLYFEIFKLLLLSYKNHIYVQMLMSASLVTIVRVLLHVVIPSEVTHVFVPVGTPNLVNMVAQVCMGTRIENKIYVDFIKKQKNILSCRHFVSDFLSFFF